MRLVAWGLVLALLILIRLVLEAWDLGLLALALALVHVTWTRTGWFNNRRRDFHRTPPCVGGSPVSLGR